MLNVQTVILSLMYKFNITVIFLQMYVIILPCTTAGETVLNRFSTDQILIR